MQPNNVVDDDHRDDIVDQIIRNCLDQDNPRSFFLFAGAGSGKTKSLIDALNFFLDKYGNQFMELRRNIAVITYTNAACDEIKRRVQYHPLFQISTLHSFSDVKLKQLHESTGKLLELWNNENDPSCVEILRIVHKEKLFELPSDIEILITRTEEEEQECTEDQLEKIDALEKAMNVPFSHFIKYYEYVSGNEGFDTHQGVKGLQFERVMTIIDDNESQGTTFNYEKLFGITEMSNRDLTNQQQGKETTIDRTRRLLYVTCSRAIDSLAIVLYVDQVDLAYEKVQACGWFKADEIEKVI